MADRYLLDTTVLIDLSRGVAGVRSRLDALTLSGAELGLCGMNVAEFISGVPSGEQPRWEVFLDEFQYWDISREAAARAGEYRQRLRRRGVTLQLTDALIAAVAATREATILTNNITHFMLIADVRIQPFRT